MFDLISLRVQPHIIDEETQSTLKSYKQLSLGIVASLKQSENVNKDHYQTNTKTIGGEN